MTSAIQIRGLKELQHKIDKLEDLTPVKAGLRAAALHVKGKIAVYPPESSANHPKTHGSWYERGFGTKYARMDGFVKGYRTSETLGRKWTLRSFDGGLRMVVGNNVSYGPYVQGPDQAAFHKRRGWKTTDKVAEEESGRVTAFLKSHVDKALEG